MTRFFVVLAASLALSACDAVTPFDPLAGIGGATGEVQPTTATIGIQNRDDFEIIHYYVVECSEPEWGEGTSVSIYPGETYEITVPGPACYDLAAAWETWDGYTHTFRYGVEVEAGQTYTWGTALGPFNSRDASPAAAAPPPSGG